MMKIKLLFLFLLHFVCLAQIPAYYNSIDFSKTGDNLKTQLTTLITSTHIINLPYTATGTTDVWDALSQTDLDPNNSNKVLLVYGYNDSDKIDLSNNSKGLYFINLSNENQSKTFKIILE